MANLTDLGNRLRDLFNQGANVIPQAIQNFGQAHPQLSTRIVNAPATQPLQHAISNLRTNFDILTNPNTNPIVLRNFQVGMQQPDYGQPSFFQPLRQFVANSTIAQTGGIRDLRAGLPQIQQQNGILPQSIGVLQTIRGLGKIAAPATPAGLAFNAASVVQPRTVGNNLVGRFSAGALQGMTGENTVAGNVKDVNTKLPVLGNVDIVKGIGSLYGFTKNPVYNKIFEATNAILPSASLPFKQWLVIAGSRGGIDNLVMSLPDMPKNLTPDQKFNFIAQNFGLGSLMSIGGEGLQRYGGKLLNTVKNTSIGSHIYDQLSQFKAKALEQYHTAEGPMARWHIELKKIFGVDPNRPELTNEAQSGIKVPPNENAAPHGTITQLEDRLNKLVGYTPNGENWKQAYYIRNAYIDEALQNAPPEVVKEINFLTNQIDSIRSGNQAGASAEPLPPTVGEVLKNQKIGQTLTPEVPGGKQRKFLDTVQQSEQSNAPLQQGVAQINPQTYEVKPNQVLKTTAEQNVKANPDAVLQDVLSSSPASDQKIANGIALAKKYQNENNYDQAVKIIDNLDQQLRDAGRTVQAASLWNNLTPEGMLRAATNAAEQVGRVLPQEVKQNILRQMKELDGLKGPEKDAKTQDILNYIADNIPASPWEKFKTAFDSYRYSNMLSGPQTHERNIYQNIFNSFITRPVDMVFQATYDLARHPFNPLARDVHFSDIPTYYKNMSVSIPDAISAAVRAFSGTFDPKFSDYGTGSNAILNIRRQKMIPGPLKIIPGALEAQDKFFSTLISQGEYARLIKNGTSESAAKAAAQKTAEEYLLRERLGKTTSKDSVFVRALDSLGQGMEYMRKLPVVGEAAKWFIPFVQTPINAAKIMVKHSPLGFAGGEWNTKQLAAATTGSVALAFSAMLASQGKTTWSAPVDPTQKDYFYASGRQPYSVNVNGKWVPMWYFGPYALSIAIPAAIQNIYADSKTSVTDSEISKITKVISNTMQFLMSQTPMQGTAGLFRLLQGDVDYTLPSIVASTVTQAIPAESFVRWVNNTFIDPVYRKGSDFVSTIKKGLPGQSQTLKPYTTPLGIPSTRTFSNQFLPYNITQPDTTNNNFYEKGYQGRGNEMKNNALVTDAKKQLESGNVNISSGQGSQTSYTIDGKEISGYTVGDKFVYLDPKTGSPTSTAIDSITQKQRADEKSLTDAQYSLSADRLIRSKDYQGWLDTTSKYIDYLTQYKDRLDPTTDTKDIVTVQKKIEDLQAQVDKYTSYGGFTKGKKSPKISISASRVNVPKPLKITLSKAPKLKIAKNTIKLTSAKQPKLHPFKIAKTKLRFSRKPSLTG